MVQKKTMRPPNESNPFIQLLSVLLFVLSREREIINLTQTAAAEG